ncbi:MAG: PTS sugar transporter subunit IIA [Spirochaetaceae bacterium]|jgi:mannitol/fructose-specific phosphotransferase system IIA component (Ntr-type)|nr:PTS sugar transporter subunit IIA [Spirochaetaceae bacterium]
MTLKELLDLELIKTPLTSQEKPDIIRELIDIMWKAGKITQVDEIVKAVEEREELCSTGLDRAIAVPHAKTTAVQNITVVLGIHPEGMDFSALDGESSKLFFLILTPPEQALAHVETLSDIAKVTRSTEFVQSLIKAKSSKEVFELFQTLE